MLNEIYNLNNDVVIKLFEDLDADAVKAMKADLASYAELSSDIVIDLKDVDFIDSSGIGAIVFLYKRMVAKGKLVAVVGLNEQPKELFKMLMLDKTIHCFDSLEHYVTTAGMLKAV
ncbi:STAS domain-containing protein [Thalassotalea euphylliae]|uniref:Anti-sigma factor antagonist n=1 Tax=Thalassotalea euphylliae TaxID=1655234 RepID=A0A3E0UIU0_9GAMM|nr:STAS domain-containing protein [Thalassotalea euphylliae]REL36537.1 anti-sigma factor antagonist [Thalassotalea euphylliae]